MIDIPSQTRVPKKSMLMILLVVSIIALLLAPLWGASHIDFTNLFSKNADSVDLKIFWQMRIPRVLVAFLAGATFALCGMVLQALFRNPLVSPSTLGVSVGASFGAAGCIWLGLSFSFLGVSSVSIFAFAGALLALLIVWFLAKTRFGISVPKMLLAGVAISFFFASLIMLIQYLSDIMESFRITRWLMGGLYVFGYDALFDILPFSLVGFICILFYTHELNLFTIGEEVATSRGVDVQRMIRILFFLISFMIGGIVAVCGPIAFIGIIAPHICRLLIGSDHRYLTPAVFLFGGIFLVVCDVVARTAAAPVEIPVGVITALLGGPFFLWLLCTNYARD